MRAVEHENISVRKVAAEQLNALIKKIPDAPEGELLSIFQSLQTDNQDIVRMAGVESCILFATKVSASKVNASLVPCIKKYGEDKSWRIRYLVADKIIQVSQAFGKDITTQKLIPLYIQFLQDQESEVRTAAISRLSEFSKIVDTSVIISKIVPQLATLASDSFQYVRIALAENLLQVLTPEFGKASTNEHILPVFLQLLRDESTDVRLALFKQLNFLNEVIGIENLSQSLLPAVNELTSHKSWRVKVTVFREFPSLAK